MEPVDVVFLVLALIALALPFAIERIKRPRIEIEARPWSPRNPVPWTFAVVSVRNKPLPRVLRAILVREIAADCSVTLEFRRSGELAVPEVPARWSSRPEPLRIEPVSPGAGTTTAASASSSGTTVGQVRFNFDLSMVPATLRQDLAPGRWEEIAVAILHQGGDAYGWGAMSYAFAGGNNPDWRLDRGVYEVTVRAQSSGISEAARFKLDNLSADFARFKLTPI
jgi:hypothetical protein